MPNSFRLSESQLELQLAAEKQQIVYCVISGENGALQTIKRMLISVRRGIHHDSCAKQSSLFISSGAALQGKRAKEILRRKSIDV